MGIAKQKDMLTPNITVKKAKLSTMMRKGMKMKNIIRSDRDGVIAQVNVNAGDLVKHNQPLFTFQA